MDWIADNLTFVGSIIVLAAALYFGPLPIVIRGVIRKFFGQMYIRRWAAPTCCGLAIGMLSYAVVVGLKDEVRTPDAVLLCLLLLLAIIDLQWRWLPIEWTLSVVILALLAGFFAQDIELVLVQMIAPSAAVFVIRFAISGALRREALGLGDVWLIAGLGGFLPVFGTFLLIGCAALSGLLEVIIRRLLKQNERQITSVSYGTHLCFVFLVLATFPQIIST